MNGYQQGQEQALLWWLAPMVVVVGVVTGEWLYAAIGVGLIVMVLLARKAFGRDNKKLEDKAVATGGAFGERLFRRK